VHQKKAAQMDCRSVNANVFFFFTITRFSFNCACALMTLSGVSLADWYAHECLLFLRPRADHLPAPAFNLIGRPYLPARAPPLSLPNRCGMSPEIRSKLETQKCIILHLRIFVLSPATAVTLPRESTLRERFLMLC
jgi:hypothetical protein